jgi:hypothetical protein
MYLRKVDGPRAVTFSDGSTMTRADLPPRNTRRWVASRKASVVRAIAGGLITSEQAIEYYALSEEELGEWTMAVRRFGIEGLKVTGLQKRKTTND